MDRAAFERDDRCPGCGLGWWLFPPARIKSAGGFETNSFRCVNCKGLYYRPPPGTTITSAHRATDT